MNTFKTISRACRYNSGTHFLDSGGSNGRHWQCPAISDNTPEISLYFWRNEVSATIETAHFLSQQCKIDSDLQSGFDEWQDDKNGTWFDLVPEYLSWLGFEQHARDNTYNSENDLSQNYVWESWSTEDQGDWIFNDEAVMVAYIHTGADIRGGYSSPLFLRANGDYSVPVDLVAGFYACEGRDGFGNELNQMQLESLCEKWSVGYSSRPSFEISKVIERIFTHTEKDGSFIAKLTSGETVRIVAYLPYV